MPDLWHEARRAARDERLRSVALQGVLVSVPTLVVAAFLWQLVAVGPAEAWAALRRPFRLVTGPLVAAYEQDRDLALIGYLLWLWLVLRLPWTVFGTALYRLAAVSLAGQPPETSAEVSAFVRRQRRRVFLTRLLSALVVVLPLGVAVVLAMASRWGGVPGTVALVVACGAAVALALWAAVAGTGLWASGFLRGPAVACDDGDPFDAVARSVTYAGAGLPRVLGLRLTFGLGVFLGSAWRALRTLLAMGLAWFCLHTGAGEAAMDRIHAIWVAFGRPPDAARLGIGTGDLIAAAVLALGFGTLAVLWVADLVSRIHTARVAVYLLLRRTVEGTPLTAVRRAGAVRLAPESS